MMMLRGSCARNVLGILSALVLYMVFVSAISVPFYNRFVFGRQFRVYGPDFLQFSAMSLLMCVPCLCGYLLVGALLGIILKAPKPLIWCFVASVAVDAANAIPYIIIISLLGQQRLGHQLPETLQVAIPIFIGPFLLITGSCLLVVYARAKIKGDT